MKRSLLILFAALCLGCLAALPALASHEGNNALTFAPVQARLRRKRPALESSTTSRKVDRGTRHLLDVVIPLRRPRAPHHAHRGSVHGRRSPQRHLHLHQQRDRPWWLYQQVRDPGQVQFRATAPRRGRRDARPAGHPARDRGRRPGWRSSVAATAASLTSFARSATPLAASSGYGRASWGRSSSRVASREQKGPLLRAFRPTGATGLEPATPGFGAVLYQIELRPWARLGL